LQTSKGSQFILDYLGKCGCQYIFGCPGTTEVPILDALVDLESPQYILIPQEGVAVSAAEGWARVTGRIGVANLHANVGLANGVSQIIAAQMAAVPLLILNCVKSREILGRGAFTTAHDHQEMVKQFTKWDWLSLRSAELMEDLRRAIQMAVALPAGPSYLGVPQDLLEAEVVGEYPAPIEYMKHSPSKYETMKAAELLVRSKFPVILAGSGVAIEGAMEAIIKLANCLGSAVVTENRLHQDYNAFPTDHPYYLGPIKPNSYLFSQADVLFAVGTRLFVEFQASPPWIPPDLPIIHLHPDSSQIGRLYPVEVSLHGSVREGLEDIYEAAESMVMQSVVKQRSGQVKQMHNAYKENLELQLTKFRSTYPIQVPYLAESISRIMNHSTTVVVDAPTSNDEMSEYLPKYNEQSFYTSASSGSLGWGLGAALGVKLGAPERVVLSIVGDGAFMFGIPALWTAAKYHIPVIFIVINNASYAAVKAGLLRYNQNAAKTGVFPGTDISGTNFAEVAKGFGVQAQRIRDPIVLEDMLKKVTALNEPYLLEVMTDPDYIGNISR